MSNYFDSSQASELIAPAVARLRSLSYSEIKVKVARGDIETGEIEAPNGVLYQFEILFYWDDVPEGDVRVISSIFMDPRGPNVTDSFIKSPDGGFVGEGKAI